MDYLKKKLDESSKKELFLTFTGKFKTKENKLKYFFE